MQKLIVRHFGPIREAEIELGRLTILIGPNGSGKTLLAKLAFFFNLLPDWIYEQLARPARISRVEEPQPRLQDTVVSDLLQKGIPKLFRSYFGSKEHLSKDTSIEFVWDSGVGMKLVTHPEVSIVQVIESSRLMEALRKIRSEIIDYQNIEQKSIRKRIGQMFHGSESRREARFVPEIRSAYWTLTQLAFRAGLEQYIYDNEEDRGTTRAWGNPFIWHFLQVRQGAVDWYRGDWYSKLDTDVALGNKTVRERKLILAFNDHFEKIAQGKISVVEYEESIQLESGKTLPMDSASSGQKDLMALLPILFFDLMINIPAFYAIEEPESHLYPLTQKELVELLALFLNASSPETRMVITTHSPYVLSAVNNLLFAYQTGTKRNAREATEAVLHSSKWVDPSWLNTYQFDLEESGCSVSNSIMKNGLVLAEEIDGASDSIGDDFDRLMEIYRNPNPLHHG